MKLSQLVKELQHEAEELGYDDVEVKVDCGSDEATILGVASRGDYDTSTESVKITTFIIAERRKNG